MSGPAYTAPVDQQGDIAPVPVKQDSTTEPQPASSAAPAPVEINGDVNQAIPGLSGDSVATQQPTQAPTSDLRTSTDAVEPQQASTEPAAAAPVDANASVAPAAQALDALDTPPAVSTPSVPEAAATLTQIATSAPAINGDAASVGAPAPTVAETAPVHINGTSAEPAPASIEQAQQEAALQLGFASPAPEPQAPAPAAAEAAVDQPSQPVIDAPVVEPAPITAPEVPPPPPVVPLPQQLAQRPPLVHVDSASSLAAQPPTPTVPGTTAAAASAVAPSTTASLAASNVATVDSTTASPAAPLPSPAAPAVSDPAPVTQDAGEVKMEDAYAPAVSGDVSPTTVLKRSAPEELNASIDQSLGGDDRDVKRPRMEAESVTPAATTESAPAPAPVQGFDPLAFSAPQSTFASSAPAPAPTMSPAEMYNAPGSAPAFNPAAPATSAIDGSLTSAPSAISPAPPTDAPAPATPIAVMTRDQQKSAVNLLRNLKRNKNAAPFLRPVDPVLQLIPDYPRVITKPMDLGTIEAKVTATGKAMTAAGKAGRVFGLDYSGQGQWEGKSDKVYRTADELKADVAQIWQNCFTYNGPPERHPVSKMAQEMKEAAEKNLLAMPAAPLVDPTAPPPPPPVEVKRDRRPSNSFVPTIRRSEDGARPKREIKTPAYDLAYGNDALDQVQMPVSGKSRTGRVSGKSAQEQLRFCKEVIKELFKKVHEPYAFPFYEPVNYIQLNIPQYPSIIKRPMDLGTVRTKLETGQYPLPPYAPFEADVRLIFRNCYTFNPPGTPVHEMGRRLEAVFDAKWEERPSGASFEDDGFSDDDGISAMQMQLASLQASIEQMKQNKRAEKERQRAAERHALQQQYQRPPKPPKRPSLDYGAPPRPPSNPNPKRPKKPKKKRESSDEEDYYDDAGDYYGAVVPAQPEETGELVTFEMKRELATKIVTFEGEALERAIDIIRQGMPALLGDANKEIELDIDQLDQRTLLTLYRFVCPDSAAARPKPAKARRNGSQPGPSKRKNLDEVKESERIEALEARLREFEKQSSVNQAGTPGASGGAMDVAGVGAGAAVGGQASSDSSSDDDSGSDSDDD
ncbi:hypothetical protein ACM66B_004548 [Microbotryomycetes sp. NB124-2]